MGHEYIQIPPDSTGRKIRHTRRIDMEVSSVLVDLTLIDPGAPVVGLTSSATGVYVGYTVEYGETYIYVKPSTGTFQAAEIITINGTNSATIDSLSEQNTSNIIVSDPNTPHHQLSVDTDGAAYVRYAEGNLGFDAFGHAQFSQTVKVDEHIFTYGDHPEQFYDEIVTSGAVTSSVSDSSIIFSTTTTSGSRITRTSHQYYSYNPGEGNELLMSYRSGDNGKANVVRRWGMFDDEDGMFFELNGTTFGVGIRSSATGTPTDNVVTVDDFNGDPLNNTNVSNYIIDYSKYNIYWLDYQWLGVGKVRFGTFAPDGTRITMHTFQHPNSLTVPYMRRGTLPLRVEQFNTGLAGSTSESRLVCAAILRQNAVADFPGHYYKYVSNLTAVSSSVFTPIISTKPKVTINGEKNRVTLIPTDFEVTVIGDPIQLDVLSNPTLSGDNYNVSASDESAFLIDVSASGSTGGTSQESLFFGSGVTHRELVEDLNYTLKLSADGATQPTFSVHAKTITPGGNSLVQVLVRWKEAV